MIDPINTTAYDGAPCGLCGDGPATWEQVEGQRIAVCDGCFESQIDTCPQCEQKFFLQNGVRIFASANLYCADCAATHPVIVAGREFAHQLDERNGK